MCHSPEHYLGMRISARKIHFYFDVLSKRQAVLKSNGWYGLQVVLRSRRATLAKSQGAMQVYLDIETNWPVDQSSKMLLAHMSPNA
jgi:hypothetical protein